MAEQLVGAADDGAVIRYHRLCHTDLLVKGPCKSKVSAPCVALSDLCRMYQSCQAGIPVPLAMKGQESSEKVSRQPMCGERLLTSLTSLVTSRIKRLPCRRRGFGHPVLCVLPRMWTLQYRTASSVPRLGEQEFSQEAECNGRA